MREIKFRGIDLLTKAWVKGSLLQSDINVNGQCKCAIVSSFAFEYQVSTTEVDFKTVGQYSEENDQNDTEIYEGDRVACYLESEIIGEDDIVEFKNASFWLRRRNITLHEWYSLNNFGTGLEVIGNIHEPLTKLNGEL
jgi:uncharacterized phage protein (TIGR01671 family)